MRLNQRLVLVSLLLVLGIAPLAGAVESAGGVATGEAATLADNTPSPARVQIASAAAPDSACTATADCCPASDGWVTCSGNNNCSAVDAACPSQRGYVQCDGVTTYCPACDSPACIPPPPSCTTTQCAKDLQCYDWCMQHEGYPGVCRNGCCICY